MWTPQYDIIIETMMGTEIEVSVTSVDTVRYIKSSIEKYEGNINLLILIVSYYFIVYIFIVR